MLGMSINLFAQEEIIVQKDKSEISVIKITVVIDTIKVRTFEVLNNAKYYLNKDNANELISKGIGSIPDSLLPRLTHMFGINTYQKRHLEIWNKNVTYKSNGEYVAPISHPYIFWICIISFIFLLIWGFMTINVTGPIVVSMIATFLFFTGYAESELTLFDVISCTIILIIPAFVLFVKNIIVTNRMSKILNNK